MKLLAVLVRYLAVSAGLFGGIIGGVLWFVKPDPNAAPMPPRVAPIAPRIAESIARKMEAVPILSPASAHTTETSMELQPVKPVMLEAPVALTPAPKVHIRELKPQHTAKHKPAREPRTAVVQAGTPAAEAAVPRPIATARTDSPY